MLRILVVEDEAIVAMDIEERLVRMGYDPVGRAASGQEAINLTAHLRPDIVLMDIRLQGEMDGIEAAHEIRSKLYVPVIFLTAYAETETLERAKLSNPYSYIIKPFKDSDLRSAIEIAHYKSDVDNQLNRTYRLLDVLGQVNQAMLRCNSREELFSSVCRLIVERGKIDQAWIGLLDPGTAHITPVASFGTNVDSLQTADFWADDRTEPGNPGKAVRDGKPFCCNDCGNTPCLFPASQKPACLGFQSSGSFPIRFKGEVCGAISICLSEPGFFFEREIALMDEIALDISFMLDKIDADARQKRAEEELHRSEELYRLLTENIKDVVWILDTESMYFRYVSPSVERLRGYTPEEILAVPVTHALTPEAGAYLTDLIRKQAEDLRSGKELPGKFYTNEVEQPCKDGSSVWTEVITNYYINPENNRVEVRGVTRDITERKQAVEDIKMLNEELEQRVQDRTIQLEVSNKELEAFSYSVSHDLRAPLRAIDGFSAALMQDYGDSLNAQAQDHLRRVRAASARMAVLIDDLLKLSRLSRDSMKQQEINMSEMAAAIFSKLQLTEPERQVEFVVRPGMVLLGDEHLILIMLENLLENAWKFTGNQPKARVEFGTCKTNGKSNYYIRDNGAGFDMAYACKLFGAFQRLHSVGEFPGNGIGLATVQRIINRHGGRIWAESEPGKGTTFSFIL